MNDMESSNLPVDQDRIFLFDNLRSHLTNQVQVTVHVRPSPNRFQTVPRPPYMPKYGPTEYVFAEVGAELAERVQPHWDMNILEQNVVDILSRMGRDGTFQRIFQHCGM